MLQHKSAKQQATDQTTNSQNLYEAVNTWLNTDTPGKSMNPVILNRVMGK